jgi:hypothetical protein
MTAPFPVAGAMDSSRWTDHNAKPCVDSVQWVRFAIGGGCRKAIPREPILAGGRDLVNLN